MKSSANISFFWAPKTAAGSISPPVLVQIDTLPPSPSSYIPRNVGRFDPYAKYKVGLLKAQALQVFPELVTLLVPGMHHHHRIIRPYVVLFGNLQD